MSASKTLDAISTETKEHNSPLMGFYQLTPSRSSPSSITSTSPSERKGRRKPSEPGKFLGVRRRPWGRYAAEIRHPTTKEKHWLGTFDTAQEAALAYDRAALNMTGTQTRTNFIYSDTPITTFNSIFTPSHTHHLIPPIPSPPPPPQPNHLMGTAVEPSNHFTNDFLFSDDSGSGDLSSIIPKGYLRSTTKSSPSQNNSSSCKFSAQIQSPPNQVPCQGPTITCSSSSATNGHWVDEPFWDLSALEFPVDTDSMQGPACGSLPQLLDAYSPQVSSLADVFDPGYSLL